MAKDTVLGLAFAWQELLQLCGDHSPEAARCCNGVPEEHRIMSVVHAICHHPSQLAETLERLLNDRYADEVAAIGREAPSRIDCLARSMDLGELVPLAGWVWAIVSDPRDQIRQTSQVLLHRVKLSALRALAFGKVEFVNV